MNINKKTRSFVELIFEHAGSLSRDLWIAALTLLLVVATVSPVSSGSGNKEGSNSQVQNAGTPENTRGESYSLPYLKLVKEYADVYGLDFRFVLALVKQESQFDPQAISSRGAIGLMQIMPPTGTEISDKLDLRKSNAPRENIHAGIYYFAEILKLFPGIDTESQLRVSLAAYFAGPGRIYDAQEVAAYMGENPTSWSSIKGALPLLSKRFYSLHRAIWEDGRPRSGYFGSWRQTLTYVDNIMENYKEYQREFD